MPVSKPKPRERIIMVRLSEAEYRAWTRAARRAGIAPATWARNMGNVAAHASGIDAGKAALDKDAKSRMDSVRARRAIFGAE